MKTNLWTAFPPLVRLYTSRAWLAALVVSAPIVILRASDLMNYACTSESSIIVMSWFELLAYPTLILLGVRLAGKRRGAQQMT